MHISMHRGDRLTQSFSVRNAEGSPFTEMLDDVFFTVKKSYNEKGYKFQKRLSNGSIITDGQGNYSFVIQPEDTNNLSFGEYDFDIELLKEGFIKQTFTGILELLKEVTYQCNEVEV